MGAVKTPHVSARVQTAIESFILQLRRRQIHGSHAVSEKMLDILRMIVSSAKWGTVNVLIDLVKLVGKRCQDAARIELCIGNTVRRLLNVIREECHALPDAAEAPLSPHHFHLHSTQATTGSAPTATHRSVFSLFADSDAVPVDYSAIKSTATKSLFVEAINEMLDEMRSLHEQIATQALAHVHANEVILTLGESTTAEAFFKAVAAKKRAFHLIIVESAPTFSGQCLAVKLAAAGIETTVIPDSGVFAVMSRVNKVVLGTHAVLANGGLVAQSGASTVAACAKHYGIPVVVVGGLYKLTPCHPYDLDVFNVLASPAAILPYANPLAARADVLNPLFDYVPPEHVSLFITNEGAYAPSYMYRLLTESYHHEDIDLEPRPGAFEKFFGNAAAAREQTPPHASAAPTGLGLTPASLPLISQRQRKVSSLSAVSGSST